MKKLAFIVFVIMTIPCLSQSKPLVEYRGGTRALEKINTMTDRERDTEEYPDARTDRFYSVEFTVDNHWSLRYLRQFVIE